MKRKFLFYLQGLTIQNKIFVRELNLSLNRVNERRYEFGDANGAESWVCAKIPHDGAIKKDCVPWGNVLVGDKTQTSKDRIFKENWNILVPFDFFLSRGRHLPGMRIFRRTGTTRLKISPKNTQSPKQQGCNGFVCFCDDRDGCNSGQRLDDHQQIFSPLENNNF